MTLPETPEVPGDPPPLTSKRSGWLAFVTPTLSLAIIAVVFWQFRQLDMHQILAVLPSTPWFWIVLVAYYSCGIVADFVIFRRLWGIPPEGLVALARKNVSNALLVDYLGEAYFYGWARKKLNMATSPFGAIKDVAILSAVVSNILTLIMVGLAFPYARDLDLAGWGRAIIGSIAVIALISTLIIIFGRRVFSLTKDELWWVAAVQLVRLLMSYGLLALAWSLALPQVAIGWWLVLATVKLLLSRLPLLSNQDALFSLVAVFLIGRQMEIELLVTLVATLTLLMHMTVGIALAAGDLLTPSRKRVAA